MHEQSWSGAHWLVRDVSAGGGGGGGGGSISEGMEHEITRLHTHGNSS